MRRPPSLYLDPNACSPPRCCEPKGEINFQSSTSLISIFSAVGRGEVSWSTRGLSLSLSLSRGSRKYLSLHREFIARVGRLKHEWLRFPQGEELVY